MQKITVFFLICFLSVLNATAQDEAGLPDITNYTQEQVKAGAQTWQIDQDTKGNMYFANNSGLLTYNGKEWKLFPLPNKTIVRSLHLDTGGRIFIGGQDEFGYFFPDERGSLRFTSLVEKIPAVHRKFGDVWNIILLKGYLFIRTTEKIFIINTATWQVQVREAPSGSRWGFMQECNGKIFAQNGKDNIQQLDHNALRKLNIPLFEKNYLTSCISLGKDSVLFVTQRNGLFLWDGQHASEFKVPVGIKSNQISTSYKINDNAFALGTLSNGIYIVNKQGVIQRHYSTRNGLQQNNIRSFFKDHQGNLWVGMDEGIDLINYSSAFSRFQPKPNTSISAYTSIVRDDKLYIGTSEGLFVSTLTIPANEDLSFSKGAIEKVNNSDGQVWSLTNIGAHTLMGHHDGSFLVTPKRTTLISNTNGGTWLFRQVPGTNLVVSGTYKGIQLYFANKGLFNLLPIKEIVKLNETLRFLEVDSNEKVIWASHPNRGVFKIKLSDDFKHIQKWELLGVKEGLPFNENNFVFKLKNEIVFATQKGIYEYSYSKNKFEKSGTYGSIFKDLGIKYLVNDSYGRIWFATAKQSGVVENGILSFLPELDGKLIDGFENIYPLNDQNIFFCSYKNLIHLNYGLYKKRYTSTSIILNKIVVSNQKDSLLFDGFFVNNNEISEHQGKANIPELSPGYNSIHFEYGSTQYGNTRNAKYSYRLKGFEDNWSDWSEKTEKDYTNLSHGSYSFIVRTKDNSGNISEPVTYSFVILPQWYQTVIARMMFLLAFAFLIYGLNILHRKRLHRQQLKHEEEQAHLKYVHELELEHNEKQIVQLENERLETDMIYKNKELASTTMHLYKRGRLLGKIKQDLSVGMDNLKTKEEKQPFKSLLKLISEEEKQDQDWDKFARHFDQVHNNFLHNIKKAYPELSSGDLKICAYLKMNLSSKEIAQLLNISLKGVEVSRYRLRKKLGLLQSMSLTNFLNEFG